MQKNSKHNPKQPLWISQNFLTNRKIINRLILKTNLNKNDHVLEIGPGKGHITNVLIKKCAKVTGVEYDSELFSKLTEKFKNTTNLKLFNMDFLKWSLPINESYKILSNIPFSITTKIIRKITGSKNPPSDMWLIMEKGAAKKYIGKPSETKASMHVKPFFNMKIVYYFQKENFHPRPSVDTVLVHFKRKTPVDISRNQIHHYRNFVESVMKYGLTGLQHQMTKRQLHIAMKAARIPRDFTPANILYVQWLCLFRQYMSYK